MLPIPDATKKTRVPQVLAGRALNAAVNEFESPEDAILYIMESHQMDLKTLEELVECADSDTSSESGTSSQVTWIQVAQAVGINPRFGFEQVATFELARARVPSDLFESIVQDINKNSIIYSPIREHLNVAMHTHYIAPVFAHIIKLFGSSIIGIPEALVRSMMVKQGELKHHFVTFTDASLLLVGVKLTGIYPTERMDAIAQLIADANVCYDWNIEKGCCHPIYCILFEGDSFTFFKFDCSQKAKLYKGTLGLSVHFGLTNSECNPQQFVQDLRAICEILLSLLLQAHSQALFALAKTDLDHAGEWTAWLCCVEIHKLTY